MTQGITGKEPDPALVYADIIDHPHWQSPVRPHMSLEDRAAQFAPFAALTGYADMVSEEARTVDRRIDLSDQEIEELSQQLTLLSESLREGVRPAASVTFFVPDPLKAGGTYETRTEQIKGIDSARGKLILARTEGYGGSYAEIDLKDILEIQMETREPELRSEE